MSWRYLIHESRTSHGDRVQLFRDNDSRTYRLFGTQGETHYGTVDMTREEMEALGRVLVKTAEDHTEWPVDE